MYSKQGRRHEFEGGGVNALEGGAGKNNNIWLIYSKNTNIWKRWGCKTPPAPMVALILIRSKMFHNFYKRYAFINFYKLCVLIVIYKNTKIFGISQMNPISLGRVKIFDVLYDIWKRIQYL